MPASLQGETQPTVYRFKLGGFEAATILDSKAIRQGLHPAYGANASADEVHALASANNIDPERFEHPNIPTLVNTGKELVLFDTGNGALPREYEALKARMPPGNLAARLGQLGHKPEDIDVVVLTHGHPDHIGGLVEGGKPVYPNARYVFGAAEYDFWKRNEGVREARVFNQKLFMTICEPLADRATFIKPGDEVVSGIHAVDAVGPFARADGVSHRKRRQALHGHRRHLHAICDGGAEAGMAFRNGRRQGQGGRHPQSDARHAGDRTPVLRQLPHAVSRHRLDRQDRQPAIAGCRIAIS